MLKVDFRKGNSIGKNGADILYRISENDDDLLDIDYFDSATGCHIVGQFFGCDIFIGREVDKKSRAQGVKIELALSDDTPDDCIICTTAETEEGLWFVKECNNNKKALSTIKLLEKTIEHYNSEHNRRDIVQSEDNVKNNGDLQTEENNITNNMSVNSFPFEQTQFYQTMLKKSSKIKVDDYVSRLNESIIKLGEDVLKSENVDKILFDKFVAVDCLDILKSKKIGKSTLQAMLKQLAEELTDKDFRKSEE